MLADRMQEAPDWTGIATGIGSIVAAVVAAIAAVRKFGSDGEKKGEPVSSDRTAQTIDAAWRLIDQLQEENARLSARIVGLEGRLDRAEQIAERGTGLARRATELIEQVR